MTYHSSFNYECPKCGARYAPFRKGVKCPKCGYESGEVYPMAEEALRAWEYHVEMYGSGVPPAYAILSLGDSYIYTTAHFLASYFDSKPSDDDKFVEDYVEGIEFDGYEYMKPHLKEYFKYVLKLVHELGISSGPEK